MLIETLGSNIYWTSVLLRSSSWCSASVFQSMAAEVLKKRNRWLLPATTFLAPLGFKTLSLVSHVRCSCQCPVLHRQGKDAIVEGVEQGRRQPLWQTRKIT
ncbi:hypothetical protein COCNU_contig69171157G000010 [Cocos nucifera]|nr:hypothetical protein [Cocos nucifera]